MAPKSCQEAEDAEEEALASLVDREPVSGHMGPPVGAAADPVASTHPQNAKPSSTRMVSSINLQSALESLDPRTLRLLWGQRELEIQALRWAIQNQREARHCRILQEVAGLPAERSSRSKDKFLQNQVQKLTLELKAQKEKAQLEKKRLEERLQQAEDALRQLEAELQAFQKSCLLQLARSSWVGRVLRSSTGSVEVVTAETLMDLSDFSENDQAPTAGEGFRLEDVDWNSIAHRYPNLFTNLESSSDQKHPRTSQLPTASPPDQWSSELCCRHQEHNLKSVEWSSLPLAGTSSSGGADSESSNSQLAAHNRVHKVTGDPPQVPSHTAKQVEARAQSLCRDSQATFEGAGAHYPSCSDLIPSAAPLPHGPSGHCGPGPASQEMSSVDPGPSKLGVPSQAARLSVHLQKTHSDEQGKNGPEPESGVDSHLWHSRRCPSPSPSGSCLKIMAVSRRQRFVRILNQSLEETVDLGGFVLQQLVLDFPVCMYRFPPSTLLPPRHHITVWGEGPCSTRRQQLSSLGREPVHFYSSRSCVTLLLNPQGEVLSEHQSPHCVTPVSRIFADNTDLSIDCFPLSEARPEADLAEHQPQPRPPRKGRVREARAGRRRPGPRVQLPRLSTIKLLRQREAPVWPEDVAQTHPELLPSIPIPEVGVGLQDCQGRKDHKIRAPSLPVQRPLGLRPPRCAGRGWTAAVQWWRCRCRARLRAGSASASSAARPSPWTLAGRCRAGPGGLRPQVSTTVAVGQEESTGGRRCRLHNLLNAAYQVNRISVHLRVENDSFGFREEGAVVPSPRREPHRSTRVGRRQVLLLGIAAAQGWLRALGGWRAGQGLARAQFHPLWPGPNLLSLRPAPQGRPGLTE
ncbi:lamin tail domain-containing protein 2 isoform X2 [Bos taurus]|uniref:lamin tail domain-containing protein 2 isoform X2 n=1 Tax=Bos taurus TaxID=9913 RepID=UPI0028CB84CD|nr:lamin tail domain-containing protein 2 isoform X2 [Bos taurus]